MTPLDLAKLVGGPGSLGFLVAGALAGIALLRASHRTTTLGRLWLAALCGLYVLMALPSVALAIAEPFAPRPPGQEPGDAGADTLVVFDGDNQWGRILAAGRVWANTHPQTVIVSGGAWLLDRLRDVGIPSDRLVHEHDSATTRDQVHYVAQYVTEHPAARVVIIGSQLQAPRISALIARAGLRVTVLGAPVDEQVDDETWYMPTFAALHLSRDACYERAALAYYRWRGWIGE